MLTANFKNTNNDKQARVEALMEEKGVDYDTAFEMVFEMGAGFDFDDDFCELECHELGDDFSVDAGAFDGGEWI